MPTSDLWRSSIKARHRADKTRASPAQGRRAQVEKRKRPVRMPSCSRAPQGNLRASGAKVLLQQPEEEEEVRTLCMLSTVLRDAVRRDATRHDEMRRDDSRPHASPPQPQSSCPFRGISLYAFVSLHVSFTHFVSPHVPLSPLMSPNVPPEPPYAPLLYNSAG